MSKAIPLDKTLKEIYPDHFMHNPVQDAFGVEIELEGIGIVTGRPDIMEYWVGHHDGSLRVFKENAQAIEYTFRTPLNYKLTCSGIKILFDYLNTNPGTQVFESYRTSIHVHVNCLSETFRTIVNYMTLCIIFDELLVSQNGSMREGNNFCLRSRDAEGQIAELIKSISGFGNLGGLHPNHRYSSTNFSSLLKFGTVEFRSLECTTDTKRLIGLMLSRLSRLRQESTPIQEK
jgi:hypothetical protein